MMGHPHSRWKLNVALLVAGAATVFTGFLIQIRFHLHRPGQAVWGLGHADWNMVHQVASFSFLAGIVWHLAGYWRAFLASCSPWRGWRRMGFYLAWVFVLAVVPALAAWGSFLVFDHGAVENTLVEIHDKAAIPLSGLLLVHVWRRRGRVLRRP